MKKNSLKFIFLSATKLLALANIFALNIAHSATITVVNLNGPGEGFNETTVASPVGGNSGSTIGQQRLIAFQRAADIWGGYLKSDVPIRVGAQFSPLNCSANSATLGSAGPTTTYRDFMGAPVGSTWYPIALASALRGIDLNPTGNHINARFSSTIGSPGCLERGGWYYGLDATPPAGKFDFVSVLLHELGHGLGFLSMVDLGSGAKAGGLDDTYMRNLEWHGATPANYPSMTNAQRLAASTDAGNLHWTGANVRAAANSTLLEGVVGDHVRMYAVNPMQQGSSVSHWDTVLTPNQMMEPSYTNPIHAPSLELPLFQDIGWTLASSPAPSSFTLSVAVTGSGSVTSSPSGINCGSDCTENYPKNTNVTLSATPYSGYSFSGWSGACTGSTSSCSVNMNMAKSVTASFNQVQQAATLSIIKIGTGSGTVTRSGGAINCGNICTESLALGTVATLTAIAASNSTFAGWSGSMCSGVGYCAFNINANTDVIANFNASSGGTTITALLENNLSGDANSAQYRWINVPANAKNLTITTLGGTGDVDLLIKYNQIPTLNNTDCESWNFGNNETCVISKPSAGIYYIMLRGYTKFSGLTLSASYQIEKSVDLSPVINFLLD